MRSTTKRHRLSELEMEDCVAAHPAHMLGEELELVARQQEFGGRRPDLVFRDRRGTLVVVELQAGTLDSEHLHRAIDYRDLVARAMNHQRVRALVVAGAVEERHWPTLRHYGVEAVILTPAEFERRARSAQSGEAPQLPEPSVDPGGAAITAHMVLERLGRSGCNTEPCDDGLVFWIRSWRSAALDDLLLNKVDLSTIENHCSPYGNTRDASPRPAAAAGIPQRISCVPVQIVAASEPILALTTETTMTCFAWLDLLVARGCPHHGDCEVVLGRRRPGDGAGYEEHIRGCVRLFQRLCERYETAGICDRAAVKRDLRLVHGLELLAGRSPEYRRARLCRSITVNEGPEAGWITVRFVRVDIGYLLAMHDLMRHLLRNHCALGDQWWPAAARARDVAEAALWREWKRPAHGRLGLLLARRIELGRGCPECLLAPKLLATIPPDALDLTRRFFAHLP